MSTTRWEKERSAWLKARAGHRLGVRRRAEQLALTARQQERIEAGVGDSAFGEVTTRNVFYRSVYREEGASNLAGWFIWTVIWMSTTFLLVGPALLIGMAAYGVWWWKVSEWGRLKSLPYYKIAGFIATIGIAVVIINALLAANGVTGILVGSWRVWPLEAGAAFLTTYLWLQLVLGFVRAGWRVRAWGWPAVEQVERAATSAVQAVELEGPDPDEQEPKTQATVPAIAPIEISVDDEEFEDWMADDQPIFSSDTEQTENNYDSEGVKGK